MFGHFYKMSKKHSWIESYIDVGLKALTGTLAKNLDKSEGKRKDNRGGQRDFKKQ